MKIKTTLFVSTATFATFMLLAGGMALLAHSDQSETVRYVAGPAWETANSAAAARTAVQSQVLRVENAIDGVALAPNELGMIGARIDEAIERIEAGGLVDVGKLQTLTEDRIGYEKSLRELTAKHAEVVATKTALLENMDGFDALSVVLHDVGDHAVEVLEEEPDRKVSWNTGLEKMWLAADGCMENRIELLTQFLVINNLEAGFNVDTAKEAIETAFAEQHDAAQRMFSTKKFDIPAPERFGGRSVPEVYWELEKTHKDLILAYVDLLTSFRTLRAGYRSEADSFLEAVQAVATDGATAARGEIAARQAGADSLGATLVFVVAFACIASIVAGVFVARHLSRRLGILQQGMERIAAGDADLRQRLELTGNDEVAATGRAFDRFLSTMSGVVSELNEISNDGHASSQDLHQAAETLAQEVCSQAATFQELSSSMQEVSNSCANAAQHTREVGTHSQEASSAAREGATQTEQLEELVAEIRSSSNEVAAVIRVIDDIAFQTNLLALNAAVEAARAGDAGKGFAVVAEEVRGLAQRSAQAARDTGQLIQAATERADNGAERAVTVTAKLQEIVQAYANVENVLSQISMASEEQNSNIHAISDAIQGVEQGVQRNSATTSQVSASASKVGDQMTRMRELVNRFQV